MGLGSSVFDKGTSLLASESMFLVWATEVCGNISDEKQLAKYLGVWSDTVWAVALHNNNYV